MKPEGRIEGRGIPIKAKQVRFPAANSHATVWLFDNRSFAERAMQSADVGDQAEAKDFILEAGGLESEMNKFFC